MVWKRENSRFRAVPPKKGHFLAKNGLKFPILGKKAVFWGLGAQFKAPLPYLLGAGHEKNMCCMVLRLKNGCFRAARPKKRAFFAQKWSKNVNIGPETLFLGLRRSVQGPPTLIFRSWTRKNMCCMVLKPETGCFRAAPPKEWAFFAQQWPKNANIGPKTLFPGLGRSVQGPQPYFANA